MTTSADLPGHMGQMLTHASSPVPSVPMCHMCQPDLVVGSPRHDPFAMDTPANHGIARWLAEHVPAERKFHLRGLHYLLVSTTVLGDD